MQPPYPGKTGSFPHLTLVAPAHRHPRLTQDTSDSGTIDTSGSDMGLIATRDRALIMAWADANSAEPATGEATDSGPATIDIHDDGAGVRFNFPAAARFRPLGWDEWFMLLGRDDLVVVFAHDPDDGESTYVRHSRGFYRIMPASSWHGAFATVGSAGA